ncbi:MAG: NAD-dependent epimerase/dehydratase family protein [Candidatus Limnocylindria bacterium]
MRTRVAVTGADGLIGGVLRPDLADRFEPRWLTRADADITDLPALERAFAGADAVVHLAATPDVEATWEEVLRPNIIGVYNAYEAARRAGVRRFVFASSNHVVGGYMHDDAVFEDLEWPVQVGTGVPLRPDSLYGASKGWGEALGRLYAEWHGMSVVCLRIGAVRRDDRPPDPAGRREPPVVARRVPGMWLSHRDCVSLVEAALTADVRFAIVNGVSDNAGRWLSLEEGRRLLGWQPLDGDRPDRTTVGG